MFSTAAATGKTAHPPATSLFVCGGGDCSRMICFMLRQMSQSTPVSPKCLPTNGGNVPVQSPEMLARGAGDSPNRKEIHAWVREAEPGGWEIMTSES